MVGNGDEKKFIISSIRQYVFYSTFLILIGNTARTGLNFDRKYLLRTGYKVLPYVTSFLTSVVLYAYYSRVK